MQLVLPHMKDSLCLYMFVKSIAQSIYFVMFEYQHGWMATNVIRLIILQSKDITLLFVRNFLIIRSTIG